MSTSTFLLCLDVKRALKSPFCIFTNRIKHFHKVESGFQTVWSFYLICLKTNNGGSVTEQLKLRFLLNLEATSASWINRWSSWRHAHHLSASIPWFKCCQQVNFLSWFWLPTNNNLGDLFSSKLTLDTRGLPNGFLKQHGLPGRSVTPCNDTFQRWHYIWKADRTFTQ